jgi:hypothetical protein
LDGYRFSKKKPQAVRPAVNCWTEFQSATTGQASAVKIIAKKIKVARVDPFHILFLATG